MALKINLSKTEEYFSGVLVGDNIIVKIEEIWGNKNNISFLVKYYSDKAVVENKTFTFNPIIDGDNFIKQAYEFLKTLEEFKDAVDC